MGEMGGERFTQMQGTKIQGTQGMQDTQTKSPLATLLQRLLMQVDRLEEVVQQAMVTFQPVLHQSEAAIIKRDENPSPSSDSDVVQQLEVVSMRLEASTQTITDMTESSDI